MKTPDKMLFRCSGLYHIMGNPEKSGGLTPKQTDRVIELQSKAVPTEKQKIELAELLAKAEASKQFSPPAKMDVHLIDLWTSYTTGRTDFDGNKYTKKGNVRELEALTLYSLTKGGKMLTKNSDRKSNEFITGECDTIKQVAGGCETLDIKCSYSIYTFNRTKYSGITAANIWQGHGYMWLFDSLAHTVVYCLMNGLPGDIAYQKRLAFYDCDQNEFSLQYIERCKQIEINHIFDRAAFIRENPDFEFHVPASEWTFDIPLKDRFFETRIERNPEMFNHIQTRVTDCREWMKNNLV
jgi:hypothetical protein